MKFVLDNESFVKNLEDNVDYRIFGAEFACVYIANTCMTMAMSLLFRYADFVRYLGGTEADLGWIVGLGTVGAICMRVFQGVAIDRVGAGRIWLGSLLMVIFSLACHLQIENVHNVWIYLVRILFMTGMAGSFGASITFVSQKTPKHRTGEMIGLLGSSGFIGMAIGPSMVDYLMRTDEWNRTVINRPFWVSMALIGAAFLSASAASLLGAKMQIAKKPKKRSVRRVRTPIWWLVRRYHPGAILVMGIAMGVGINIPFAFVRPFARELSITGIGPYFLVYAGTAFTVRLFCRKLPDVWGVRPAVLVGTSFLAASMFSFALVSGEITLLLPAALGGVAHAFVFPAAMAGGSLSFPLRYRGLATTLMLTMFDLGNLAGQPVFGTLVSWIEPTGWPAYPLTFSLAGCLLVLFSGMYWALSSDAAKEPDSGEFSVGIVQTADIMAAKSSETSTEWLKP